MEVYFCKIVWAVAALCMQVDTQATQALSRSGPLKFSKMIVLIFTGPHPIRGLNNIYLNTCPQLAAPLKNINFAA